MKNLNLRNIIREELLNALKEEEIPTSPFSEAEEKFLAKFVELGTRSLGILYTPNEIGIREFLGRSGKDFNLTPDVLSKLMKDGIISIVPYGGYARNQDYTLQCNLPLDELEGLSSGDDKKDDAGGDDAGDAAATTEESVETSQDLANLLVTEQKKSLRHTKSRVYTGKSRTLRRLPKGYVVYLERIIKILGEKLRTDLEKQHLVADILDNLAHNFGLTPKQVYRSFIFYNSQNRLKNIVKEEINEIVKSTASQHKQGIYKFMTPVFPASYDVNSDNPGKFVDTVVNNIIQQIQAVPEAAADYKIGMLQLDPKETVFIRAGASNSWGGQSMPYTLDNNYKSTNIPTPKPGEFDIDANHPNYKRNKDLALARANKFFTILVQKLKEKGINISGAKKSVKPFIVDTGGKTDKDRPADKKNPGQHIFVNIRFKRDKFNFEKIKVSADQVMTGAYFCNGMNSKGQMRSATEFCGSWKDQRLSAFEIKYKPNVVGNDYVVPVARWYLNWGKDGMIKSFTLVKYDPLNKDTGVEIGRVKESIQNTTCKKYMTLVNPNRWQVAVEPFFTKPWTMPTDAEKAAYGKVFDK